MLIGVDETGTVASGERFIVAVALIRPSSLAVVTSRLERWEALTRRRIPGRPEEVKSTALNDEARKRFVNKVLLGNDIFYYCVELDVDDHVLEWGEHQRAAYLRTIEREITTARGEGRTKMANQLTTMAGWVRRTPPGMMIKMTALNCAIAKCLNQAIGTSVAYEFDEELADLRFSIDEGFIRGGPDFWKDLLRSNLMQATQREPTIEITTWPADHPFLATFVEESVGDYRQMSNECKRRFEFRDSTESVEVRVADQIAGLLRRRRIAGDNRPYLDAMARRALKPETIHLTFGDLAAFELGSPPDIQNLYEVIRDLREGVE